MQFVIETQSRERLDRNRSLVVTDRLGADCPMSVFDSARGRFLVADAVAVAVAVADAGKRDALEPVCGITLLPESQAEQAYTRCRRCRTGSRWRCSLWQTLENSFLALSKPSIATKCSLENEHLVAKHFRQIYRKLCKQFKCRKSEENRLKKWTRVRFELELS